MKSKKNKEKPLVTLIKLSSLSRKNTFLSLGIGLLLIMYMTWPTLSIFNGGMFSFHDPTQVGRVISFVHSLQTGHIPPRLAPEFSFNLGFPVFNFYAPTAYWITSFIVLLGIIPSQAVKISFLFSLMCAFNGMFFFLRRLFNSDQYIPSIIGASVYVTSTYFATEIIVRGNLAESWFLALLPFSLGLLIKNSLTNNRFVFTITTIVCALLFTSHNMMMLFAVPIVFIFLFFYPQKLKNVFVVLLALLVDSYFLIPAFTESSFVQATQIAKEYDYSSHFLCAWQLWTANGWGFGGSLPGCDADTMSFKIGKIQMILGVLGIIIFYIKVIKKFNGKFLNHFKQNYLKISASESLTLSLVFISVISIGSLFLTLHQSEFIWKAFSSVMSLFQFPWRFVVFGLFGVAVFSGYLFHSINFPLKKLLTIVLLFMLFIPARKYFIKPLIPITEYEQEFGSKEYLTQHLAFKMPEYIAKGVNISYWRSLEPMQDSANHLNFDSNQPVSSLHKYSIVNNEPFLKKIEFYESGKTTLNIHYLPLWKIFLNNSLYLPQEFDQLVRPVIEVKNEDTLEIRYEQTFIEKFANGLTLLGFVILLFIQFTSLKLQPIFNRFFR